MSKDSGKRLRIGVIKNSATHVQPAVKDNFEASLPVLRDFADVVDDVTFPSFDYDAITGTIIRAEGASAFLDLLESGRARELQCPSDRWGGYAAMTVLAVDYLQAMRIRSKVQQTLDKLYADFDALVSPARATVAYPISVNFQKAYPEVKGGAGPAVIPAGNLAGQPAISVPNGLGSNSLPTGIQFTGRAWSEARILAIAEAFQKRTDWHKKRPPLKA